MNPARPSIEQQKYENKIAEIIAEENESSDGKTLGSTSNKKSSSNLQTLINKMGINKNNNKVGRNDSSSLKQILTDVIPATTKQAQSKDYKSNPE